MEYGPEHLPALKQTRDIFLTQAKVYQDIIDKVEAQMKAEQEWWSSLTPEQQLQWKMHIETMGVLERDSMRRFWASQSIKRVEVEADITIHRRP
jgi:hypothetical protein